MKTKLSLHAAESVTLIAVIAALVILLCLPAVASDITGYVYTPFGTPFSEVPIVANQQGNLLSYGQARTWASTPVGWYSINTLTAGTHALMMNEKDGWFRVFRFNLNVPSGSLPLNVTYDYNDYITGITWDPYTRVEWCQSFMATGTSIISVGLNQAIENGPDTTITIHEGTPTGPQIGPARIIPTHVANFYAAYWSNGEVPTVPGNIYCVKLTAASGQRPFIGGAKVRNSNAFPDGRTWKDGQLTNGPVRLIIGEDNDGILTVVSTKKTNRDSQPLGFWSGANIGQTFTAKGSSFLSVSVLVGGTLGNRLIASVHDDVGTGGAGGTQIGPAKYINPIDWNARSAAVWQPGEVPLQAGQTYYVKIKREDGGGITVYHPLQDEYAGGNAYINGIDMGMDLSTTICCEEFTGSTNIQKIGFSNINVTRTTNSATITWTTSTAATTNYVDYGLDTPYTHRKYEQPAGSTSHSITLTGLSPNTLYHCRLVGAANGKRTGYSRDFVFATDPLTSNLLTNPGFENGNLNGWTTYSYQGTPQIRNYPAGGSSNFFGAKAHGGNYFIGDATNGSHCKGGVYQRVPVAANRPVKLRVWLWTWQQDNLGAFQSYTSRGRIGVDTTGGTSQYGGNIVWSSDVAAQDLFGTRDGTWTELQVTATPKTSYATVFIEAGSDSDMAWTVYAIDDAYLTQEPAPTVLTGIGQLKTVTDGTFVSIPNMFVSATESQVGAIYLEQDDRSAGVRIETMDSFTAGNKVAVTGYVGARPSGERYLFDVKKTSDAASDGVEGMLSVAKSIGKVDVGNVGMLMRVAGKVSAGGTGYVYINDGSMPAPGLKVITSSLTTPPTAGQNAAFTGIVQLEGTTPAAAKPVVYPRSQADVATY